MFCIVYRYTWKHGFAAWGLLSDPKPYINFKMKHSFQKLAVLSE